MHTIYVSTSNTTHEVIHFRKTVRDKVLLACISVHFYSRQNWLERACQMLQFLTRSQLVCKIKETTMGYASW